MSTEDNVDDKKRYRHPEVEGEILVRPGQVANREAAGWVLVADDDVEAVPAEPGTEPAVVTPTSGGRARPVVATEKES